jgi:hypothetical protein
MALAAPFAAGAALAEPIVAVPAALACSMIAVNLNVAMVKLRGVWPGPTGTAPAGAAAAKMASAAKVLSVADVLPPRVTRQLLSAERFP